MRLRGLAARADVAARMVRPARYGDVGNATTVWHLELRAAGIAAVLGQRLFEQRRPGLEQPHGHNFTLLWRTELPKFCGLPSTASNPPDFTTSPQPCPRNG